ncbi:hypothetical protein SXIM_05590 [Streptomyces xiamenensis]|uniref:Uncharacterized protein n=1 Tax=Streptomyces xiamenensis TaxID=408015 RepID=A0A0F7FPW3_9ACTN|nr:hypothetical protein SXIM_05590 [Streptomyces xiamenensis]
MFREPQEDRSVPPYQHLKGILVTFSRPHREQRVVVTGRPVP